MIDVYQTYNQRFLVKASLPIFFGEQHQLLAAEDDMQTLSGTTVYFADGLPGMCTSNYRQGQAYKFRAIQGLVESDYLST